MSFTKRNHYNPCFWTAFWNPDFFELSLSGSGSELSAREQPVHALSVKSNKIFRTKVKNVHFDKNLGAAKITLETAKAFCRRNHPDKYEEFCRKSTEAQYPVYIDFEEVLMALEQMLPYKILLRVVKRQKLASPEEKVFLASFVFLQLVRSHAIMNSMLEMNSELGFEKFEYFIHLKWMLSDTDFLFQAVAPLVLSQWTLYRTERDTFPLTDSAILVQPKSVMVALSPRLLLEISSGIPAREDEWRIKDSVKPSKLAEFRRRTIGNTFREIIFSDKGVLTRWKKTEEFRQRVKAVKEMGSYNVVVARHRERELWHINAFGNQT